MFIKENLENTQKYGGNICSFNNCLLAACFVAGAVQTLEVLTVYKSSVSKTMLRERRFCNLQNYCLRVRNFSFNFSL